MQQKIAIMTCGNNKKCAEFQENDIKVQAQNLQTMMRPVVLHGREI